MNINDPKFLTGETITAARLAKRDDAITGAVPKDGSEAMTGTLTVPAVKVGGVVEKGLSVYFTPNLVSNQKAHLILGNIEFLGNIEVEVTSAWDQAQAQGCIKRLFSIAIASNNGVIPNESRYIEAIGPITAHLAIGSVTWDAANSRWYIPIVHRSSAQNRVDVRVRAASPVAANVSDLLANLAIGPVYTSDATVYPEPFVELPATTKIGGRGITNPGGAVANSIPVTDGTHGAVGRALAIMDGAGAARSGTTPGGTEGNSVAISDGAGAVGMAKKSYVVDDRPGGAPVVGDYMKSVTHEFQTVAALGLGTLSTSTYVGLTTMAPWSDDSGGKIHQWAYANDGLFVRTGSSVGGWGAWAHVIDGAGKMGATFMKQAAGLAIALGG